ncbi:MAG: aminotransferase class I/II-fold pyridoxal phosphate-dependent enzyme, partial [Rudanella sp.]|nr:aminotransferase class I/II-fold pyridoxal phosphate-dependent enzyme [Rudanella sp.]
MNQPPAFRIPLSVPHLSGSEWGFLQEQDLTSLLLLTGLVERELCQATGADFALATPSGTAALELALRILHIGPGDLVVCPTLTFSATANAITATGATPVFVGSEPTTWGLDPDALETALKTLPK